jgi:hypothetical protein
LRMAGPFLVMPVISQISVSSVSGRSTVIFISLKSSRIFNEIKSDFSFQIL